MTLFFGFLFFLIDDNPVAFVLLFCEMMQSVFMNSFCIGVIYARVSRALVGASFHLYALDESSLDYFQ